MISTSRTSDFQISGSAISSHENIQLEPKNIEENAYILEFKVHDAVEETSLQDTVRAALKQIETKHYEQNLLAKGVAKDHIHKYGFAFEGKRVLIG